MNAYGKKRELMAEYKNLVEYEDTGCALAKKCVECLLPKCKYDDRSWFLTYKILCKKRNLIRQLIDTNKSNAQLAAEYNLAPLSVYRTRKKLLKNEIDLYSMEIFYQGYEANNVQI